MVKTFKEAWAAKEAEGYQYGPDALEQVEFGWQLAQDEIDRVSGKFARLENEATEALQALHQLASEIKQVVEDDRSISTQCDALRIENERLKGLLHETFEDGLSCTNHAHNLMRSKLEKK